MRTFLVNIVGRRVASSEHVAIVDDSHSVSFYQPVLRTSRSRVRHGQRLNALFCLVVLSSRFVYIGWTGGWVVLGGVVSGVA